MDHQLFAKSRHQRPAAFRLRRRATPRDERGFTFVEALIAVGLLAGGMVAVAQLLVISIQMHHLGRRTAEASAIAAAKLDELMKANFDTSAAIAVTPLSPDPLATNVANHFDSTAAGYTRRWSVVAGPAPNTRRVTLRVIPPNLDRNRFRTVEITTIVRRW